MVKLPQQAKCRAQTLHEISDDESSRGKILAAQNIQITRHHISDTL